jgi:hypothetical protein
MPSLSETYSKEARATVYRVIRHAIVDAESAALFRQHGLDWYLVRYVFISLQLGEALPDS